MKANTTTPWTPDEHNRFLEALETFPSGPWKRVSAHVATHGAPDDDPRA